MPLKKVEARKGSRASHKEGMNDARSIATALWQTREGGEAFALAGPSIRSRFQEPMMAICTSHVLNAKKM